MKTLKIPKLRKKRFFDGSEGFLQSLMRTIQFIPRWKFFPGIVITRMGLVVTILYAVLMIVIVTMFELQFPIWTIQPAIAWVVANIFLAGRVGIEFRKWCGLEALVFRRKGESIPEEPISLPVTRGFFYGLLALNLGFWIWFKVFSARPQIFAAWLLEKIIEEPAFYAQYQFQMYSWLLPVLCFAFAFALIGFDHVMYIKYLMKRTTTVIMLAIGFFIYNVWHMIEWYDVNLLQTWGGS